MKNSLGELVISANYSVVKFKNNRFDDIYITALYEYERENFNKSIFLLEKYIDKIFNFYYEPYYLLSDIYKYTKENDKSNLYNKLGDFILSVREWHKQHSIEKCFIECWKLRSSFPEDKIFIATLNFGSFFLWKDCIFLSEESSSLYYNFSTFLFKCKNKIFIGDDILFLKNDFLFKPIFFQKRNLGDDIYKSLEYEALITIINGNKSSSRGQSYKIIWFSDENIEEATLALANLIKIFWNKDEYCKYFFKKYIQLSSKSQKNLLSFLKTILSKKEYKMAYDIFQVNFKKVDFILYIRLYKDIFKNNYLSEKELFIFFNKNFLLNFKDINVKSFDVIKLLEKEKLDKLFKHYDVYQVIYSRDNIRSLLDKNTLKRKDNILLN